jgi:hypothetical protein
MTQEEQETLDIIHTKVDNLIESQHSKTTMQNLMYMILFVLVAAVFYLIGQTL